MIHVEVQAHPDGVGGDKVIHVAVLIHRDLRVPGPGRQRPHDHGHPALLPPHQLGQRIEVIDRETHDGRTPRHPADLLRPGIGERREPFASHELHLRHQCGNRPAHGVRPHEQGLMQPPRVQQAFGEHMATLGIGAKLYFVDGDEIGAQPLRHRLDRADPVLRALRHDPLFAGDQRHDARPAQGDDPVIDLARQKTQRQPDDSRAMRQHPFDGVVSLARIRRAENGRDARHPRSPSRKSAR